jgi:hypothetical protein
MADGRWVMTEEELNSTVLGFGSKKPSNMRELPNYGKHKQADNRRGKAQQICAFCGSRDLITGLGGFGEGFGYRSSKCKACGGTTDFVYKDDIGKYFK